MIMEIKDPEKQREMMSKIIESQEDKTTKVQPEIKPLRIEFFYKMMESFEEIEDPKPLTIKDLQKEIKLLNTEIKELKKTNDLHKMRLEILEINANIPFKDRTESSAKIEDIENNLLNELTIITYRKWHVKVNLKLKNGYSKKLIALLDTGVT